ncbi:MAG: hypothetical protein IPP07_06310 [Holophagales bacterium]|jgi:hypothetical protein|nr:hypothetical protein [Holophagales bacterium]MBK9964517.1 hypothetical protein [Holophagales bacterium]
MEFEGLPGADLVRKGLADLARGEVTEESLLVSIGSPRLRLLGVKVAGELSDAEGLLYRLLAESNSDAAHGRFNALVRLLVSFERALARAA